MTNAQDTAQLNENWMRAIVQQNEEFKDTHDRSEFVFTLPELRLLGRIYTIQTLAQQALDDKLNTDILPRVGIAPNNNVKILYDLAVGRFCVWIPKKPLEANSVETKKENPKAN